MVDEHENQPVDASSPDEDETLEQRPDEAEDAADASQAPVSDDKPQVNPAGNTTHDLRAAAEEAVRLFNESQATDREGNLEEGVSSTGASPIEIGNTTYDLAQEAYKAMQMEMEQQRLQEEAEAEQEARRTRFTQQMVLRIDVPESQKTIRVAVSDQDIIIGRADNVTDYTPEIDLTAHGAYRLGLSRRHAMIRRDGEKLILKDLNSRNGTYVNGEAIKGGDTHALRDGDELRFGNLTTRVNYIKNEEN